MVGDEKRSKDIFEILGIDSREDCYTDLIKYFFDNWKDFKIKFIKWLAKNPDDDFKLEIRNTYNLTANCNVNIETDTEERKKIVPDLILHSNKEIIIIENKIFSKEAYNQTKEYASEQYRSRIQEKFNLKEATFSFYFVTLEGIEAKDRSFRPIPWSELIKFCCDDITEIENEDRLKILVKDLIKRCEEYDNIKKPQRNETINTYLDNRNRFVTTTMLFKVYMEEVLRDIKDDLKCEFGQSNNKNGDILQVWLYKDEWKEKELEECSENDNCRFIHIEFSMEDNSEKIRLCIHYETYPYKTSNECKKMRKNKVTKKVLSRYDKTREKFKKKIYSKIHSKEWKKIGKCITLMETEIPRQTELYKMQQWAKENINLVYKVIQDSI